jgi:hypothetical protein
VRQQQLEFVVARSCQRKWEILQSNHRIIRARQPERSAVIFETHALINQHGNSFGAEKIGNQSGVCPVIVIAQHRVDAMPGAQSTKQFRAGSGVGAFLGNIVTG